MKTDSANLRGSRRGKYLRAVSPSDPLESELQLADPVGARARGIEVLSGFTSLIGAAGFSVLFHHFVRWIAARASRVSLADSAPCANALRNCFASVVPIRSRTSTARTARMSATLLLSAC